MLSQTNVKMRDCMGRQGHFIDDLLILMANRQGRTTSAGSVDLLHILHRQSAEQYNRIELH